MPYRSATGSFLPIHSQVGDTKDFDRHDLTKTCPLRPNFYADHEYGMIFCTGSASRDHGRTSEGQNLYDDNVGFFLHNMDTQMKTRNNKKL